MIKKTNTSKSLQKVIKNLIIEELSSVTQVENEMSNYRIIIYTFLTSVN